MPRQTPYLQRRGDTLFFRIAVPADLRQHIGWREVTKSLCTAEKDVAVPIALEYAALVKRVFIGVRAGMAEKNSKTLPELLVSAKHKLRLDELRDQHQDELEERDRAHREELRRVKLEAEAEAMRGLLTGSEAMGLRLSPIDPGMTPAARKTASVPTFKVVVDAFLDGYQKDRKQAMFKKHGPVLTMLLDVVGDKPITELKQADLNGFFAVLERLPPKWRYECNRRKLTVRQLADLRHPETLGPKSFDDTYKACVRAFLKVAKRDWQDQGFPTTLTTDGIEYQGSREEGENKQRAFNPKDVDAH